MNSADGTIPFNSSFSQNSFYLRVRLRERFVNPPLLKQLAVYKITEDFLISARSNKSIFSNNYAKTKKATLDWVNYAHNQGGPLIQLQTFQGDITVGE